MNDKQKFLIKDVMTTCPHSIGIDQTLATAKEVMNKHNIRHLPVQEAGKLVGVLSDRDISYLLAMESVEAEQLKVDDAYTDSAYSVNSEEDLKVVADTMAKERIGCCLVTEGNDLVGIFSSVDACKCLAEML